MVNIQQLYLSIVGRGCPAIHMQMKIKAVIFDMDGTITEPLLDFDRIRAELDLEGPILEALEKLPQARRKQGFEILENYEDQAARNATLNPGAQAVLEQLRATHRSIGLVTRNSRRSVERVCQTHHLSFEAIVTRQDGPVKPDPFSLRRVCHLLKVTPQESMMVGDYLFDLLCAKAAGVPAVLLATHENYQEFKHHADAVIEKLEELPQIIENFENQQTPSTAALSNKLIGPSSAAPGPAKG